MVMVPTAPEHGIDLAQEIPRKSFFSIGRGMGSVKGIFRLYAALGHLSISESDLNAIQTVGLARDVRWITGDFPRQVWRQLPVATHRLSGYSAPVQQQLERALGHLHCVHPSAWRQFQIFVRSIVWTGRDPQAGIPEHQLTSASFPSLPFCIFLSNKALHHIPPKTVIPEPSYRYLAENLYHEAIHQQVTFTLLCNRIFTASYHSANSPRIPIPWRADDSSARNRHWELDRALHAMAVYNGVLALRIAELGSADLTEPERNGYVAAGWAACSAACYLAGELIRHREAFTENGFGLIKSLATVAALRTAEFQSLALAGG